MFQGLFEVMAALLNEELGLEELLGLCLKVGEVNVSVMASLDSAHATLLGTPEPSKVNRTPVEGKCILISGHDLCVLKQLLEYIDQVGEPINVYTHCELLPAFGYPELKKHKNLVGNFGGAWYDQCKDFRDFPGPILLTTNCLIQPQPSYKKRLFT